MARRLTRREYTLLGLLAAVGGIVLYVRSGDPTGARAAADGASPLAALAPGEAPVVQIGRLAGGVEDYNASGRNLFQYYTPPPPPPAPVPVFIPPPTLPPEPVPVVQQPVVPPPPPAPRPPPIPFSYVGYLGPKDNKIAVLEEGKEILLVRAGSVVRSQFRIVGFGYESLVVGYMDEQFAGQTTELKQAKSTSRKR